MAHTEKYYIYINQHLIRNQDFKHSYSLQRSIRESINLKFFLLFTVKSLYFSQVIRQNSSDHSSTTDSKGLVLIFNYTWKNEPGPLFRRGAESDGRKLRNLFDYHGYKVLLYEDKTKFQTIFLLKRMVKIYLKQRMSLIVFFQSHGDGNLKDSHFLTFEQDNLTVSEILQVFSQGACSEIDGIPKMIFLNYCRQNNIITQRCQSNDETSWNSETSGDLSIFQANFLAPRKANEETMLVKCLCEKMNEDSNIFNFRDLIIQLQNQMEKYGALQVPLLI